MEHGASSFVTLYRCASMGPKDDFELTTEPMAPTAPMPMVADADGDGQCMDMSTEADEHDGVGLGGNEPNKRSERKRQREKQRRFDLSNAFDELAAFIAQVEPESEDADLDGKKKKRKSDGEDASGITRLDLIGRALHIMKRLHRENEERKGIIASMHDRGGPNEKVRRRDVCLLVSLMPSSQLTASCLLKVMVMVPTLAPVGEESYPVARASYPTAHYGRPPSHYYQPPHSSGPSPPSQPPVHTVGQSMHPSSPYPPTQPQSHPGTHPPTNRPPSEYPGSTGGHGSPPYPHAGWNRYGAPQHSYHGQPPPEQGMAPLAHGRGPPRHDNPDRSGMDRR